jgi:hypothetical protein
MIVIFNNNFLINLKFHHTKKIFFVVFLSYFWGFLPPELSLLVVKHLII